MKVLIGVDPHKGSVAVAAVDEASGELLERASFPQERRARCPRYRLGRLAQRAAGCARSRVRLGGALRLLSERREDLVAERTRALNRLHGLLRDLVPGGVARENALGRPGRTHLARPGRPQSSSSRLRRRLASEVLRDVRRLDRKIADLNGRIEAEVEASGTTLTEIFGIGPILAAKIIGTVGSVARFPSRGHFASYSGTAPVEASSGEVVRHRLSLAGNRHLNYALHMVERFARPGRTLGVVPISARRSRRASSARRRCGA